MADRKIGPNLEVTMGLPRRQFYERSDEPAGLPVPKERRKAIAVAALPAVTEIAEEDIRVIDAASGETLPETSRDSPTLTIRVSADEMAALDRARGLSSRNAYVRTLLQRAIQAMEGQG